MQHPDRARRSDLADQLEQDDLLLERLEDRPQRAGEVQHAAPGQVGRAGQRDALLAPLDQRLQQHGGQRGHRPAQLAGHLVDQGLRPAAASSESRCPPSLSLISRRSSVTSSAAIGAGQLDQPLLDPAGVGDHHQHQPGGARPGPAPGGGPAQRARLGYCTTATCRVSWASSRTVRCTTSSRSTAPTRNALDRPALGRGERLDPGQPVDEEPVALVGRHPAGAGVRLADVALLLQHGHVVAHGGRGDAAGVPLDQGLAADRLLGGDVVLDDGAQHVELAIVETHPLRPHALRIAGAPAHWHSTERVPVYVGGRRRDDHVRRRPGSSVHRRPCLTGGIVSSALAVDQRVPTLWRMSEPPRPPAGDDRRRRASARHRPTRIRRRRRRRRPTAPPPPGCRPAARRRPALPAAGLGALPAARLRRTGCARCGAPPRRGYANSDEKTWVLVAHFGGAAGALHRRRPAAGSPR